MSRTKNTATAEEICGVIRQSIVGLQDEAYLKTDLDDIVEKYEKLICNVYKVTSRPLLSVFQKGALLALSDKSTNAEVQTFSSRVLDAFAYIKVKAKSTTTGKKLMPAVFRCVQALMKVDEETSDSQLQKSASSKQLQKSVSTSKLPCGKKLGFWLEV